MVREPLSVGEAVELARLLRAVADPVRLRLLSLIGAHAGGEACVCELLGAFDLGANDLPPSAGVAGGWVDRLAAPGQLGLLPGCSGRTDLCRAGVYCR